MFKLLNGRILRFASKAKWLRHGSYILSTNVIRPTKTTLAYNRLEYFRRIQKIGGWRRLCFLKVEKFWRSHVLSHLMWYLSFGLDLIVRVRGEHGQLRVGVRRMAKQLNPMPSSVISSQSMHLGVLATASHAVMTRTLFVVYYKPRCVIFSLFCFKYHH